MSDYTSDVQTVGELVRKSEQEYNRGTTQISKYVEHQLYDTINTIEAYLNSKFISGDKDSLGRDKPFFNIVVSRANIWQRATDIDRSQIKIRATKTSDTVGAFILSQHLQQWMRDEEFGMFLNEWGRVLARYGSAIIKFVKNSDGLHINVTPWNRIIVDAVSFDPNPKIELLELTEAQLREKDYDEKVVDSFISAKKPRETTEKQRKDNLSNYYKLYEVHGRFSLAFYKKNTKAEQKIGPKDNKIFFDQMHVYAAVEKKVGGKKEILDFSFFAGREDNPYMITHLNPEDGRTLAIGPVEQLFIAQWMANHSTKNEKDALDIATRIAFQTSDDNYLNRNVLTSFESGAILIHAKNEALTKLDTSKPDIVSVQNNRAQWQSLGNELVGISEAMLGAAAKSGTAWRQTQALLQESHSLFEQFTETKGLHLIRMLRERIIPHVKRTKMNTSKEIAAILEQHDIEFVDKMYVPREAIRRHNKAAKDNILQRKRPVAFNQELGEDAIRRELEPLRNQRFFKPSDVRDETWKKILKNLEETVEIDITGESTDVQSALATLDTALKMMLTPGFAENSKAQAVVGKILTLAGTMSPIEYGSIINKGAESNVPQPAELEKVPQI